MKRVFLLPQVSTIGLAVIVGALLLQIGPHHPDVGNDSTALPPEATVASSAEPPLIPWRSHDPDMLDKTLDDALQRIAYEQKPIDCAVQACLALTFDDGPDATSTPQLLDALKRHRAHATFFLIGNQVQKSRAVVQRISSEGNTIGNHSWAHPYFTKLKPEQMTQQINDTQKVISEAGVTPPFLFRPPYGAYNQKVLDQAQMSVIMWNVDPKDWSQKDSAVIAQTVISSAKPGAIILMHDHPTTAAAMDRIIVGLQEHYRLVTVDKLLSLNPASRGLYFSR